MNISDLSSYGSHSRKWYALRLLSNFLGKRTLLSGVKGPLHSILSSIFLDGILLVWLYTYILAKLLQHDTKFIQKTKPTPGFKNHLSNLNYFRQAVESPKSWNSMGYIFGKNTFLQLTHYMESIYLTLLSTSVKIQEIPYVIFETISHFSRHNSSVFFYLKH